MKAVFYSQRNEGHRKALCQEPHGGPVVKDVSSLEGSPHPVTG